MRISRLRLHEFRGWPDLDLRPGAHVLLAGVPRAGRSDIVVALTRLLDPASIRVPPTLADIRQQRAAPAKADDPTAPDEERSDQFDTLETGGTSKLQSDVGVDTLSLAALGEVEVTLVGLDQELEQLCDGFLEPLNGDEQVDETGNAAPDAPLGVRLSYRVSYDSRTDALEHVVFFPARSNPTTAQYARVPIAIRRALPIVVLNAKRPFQLRNGGVLRQLVVGRNADAASAAFRTLEQAVVAATDDLSTDETIAATINAVLEAGGLARHLVDAQPKEVQVRFRPEDGSLSALLRAVQPALELDDAGLLTLSNHGSTATAVLGAAEALLLTASVGDAVVLGDDFGDDLDAATA